MAGQLLDLHKMHAAAKFGVLYSEVTPGQRQAAKQGLYFHLYTPPYQVPALTEAQFRAMYSATELKQLALDTGWKSSSERSLYDHVVITLNWVTDKEKQHAPPEN